MLRARSAVRGRGEGCAGVGVFFAALAAVAPGDKPGTRRKEGEEDSTWEVGSSKLACRRVSFDEEVVACRRGCLSQFLRCFSSAPYGSDLKTSVR